MGEAGDGSALSSPAELLARAARIYRERWRVVFVILGAGAAAGFAGLLASSLVGAAWLSVAPRAFSEGLVFMGAGAMALLVAFFLWTQVALCVALTVPDPAPDAAACFQAAWSKAPGFLWVCLLWMAASVGGLFLLVVPGLLAGVWLAFGPFIYLTEGVGGLDALLKSRHYVGGRSRGVLGRLSLASAAATAPAAVPVGGALLWLMAWPFALINVSVLLDDLRRLSRGAPFVPERRGRLLVLLCAAGLLVPAALAPRAADWARGRLAPLLGARGVR